MQSVRPAHSFISSLAKKYEDSSELTKAAVKLGVALAGAGLMIGANSFGFSQQAESLPLWSRIYGVICADTFGSCIAVGGLLESVSHMRVAAGYKPSHPVNGGPPVFSP